MKGPATTSSRRIAVLLLLAAAGPARAFHSGGVAECDGCHTMHASREGRTARNGLTQFQPGAYLLLGQVDDVYRILFDSLDRDHLAWVHRWDMLDSWSPEARAVRADPRFGKLAERIGMVDYWKQYGYPDGCKAGTDVPIVCH